MTVTSTDLRRAATEARQEVLDTVRQTPGIAVNDLYGRLTAQRAAWQQPAVRTAIWDLVAERQVIVRHGNALHPGSVAKNGRSTDV